MLRKMVIPSFVTASIFVLSLCKRSRAEGAFVCHSFSDSCGGNPWDTANERIKSLEEKIRVLQKLVETCTGSVPALPKDTVPKDCTEIYNDGSRTDGVYVISPDSRCPFRVYCDMTNGGWTLIQRRQDGSVNFHRTWDEYVEGFGDVEGEHWLGLEKIHRLTRTGSQIYFHLENYDGSVDHAHYKVFKVHEATTLYKMNVDKFGYVGTIGEYFSYHDGMKFSTFDRDNDAHRGNCVKDSFDGGAWWYKSCYQLGNFNGLYGKREAHGLGYWSTEFVPIRNTQIKLKPRFLQC